MALSEQTLTIIFNLQRQLIEGIDEATALDSAFFAQFGEKAETATAFDLEQLQNVRQRLTALYSRSCTLLLRIAEF